MTQHSAAPGFDGECPPDDACANGTPDRQAEVGQNGQRKTRSEDQHKTASQEEDPENRPTRGYSWPPFQPGHTLSMVHGARSPRAITARAEQVHQELLTVAPYLAEDKFLPAVNRYLQAAAREALLHQHIERVSAEKGTGHVASRVWEQATAAARLAAKLGSDLGLDPIGHARIRALSAGAGAAEATLQDLADRGAAVRRRRQQEALTDG